MAEDFSKRKNQVIDEGISPIKENSYTPSRLVIHEHKAERAGSHYDIRFDMDGRAISFATKRGLPKEPGKPTTLFRVSDHKQSYMDWQGVIEKGQYGAGVVEVAADHPIVLRSSPNRINFTVSEGDQKGSYALIKQNDKEWLAIKKKELERSWAPRKKYKEVKDIEPDKKLFATAKIDGANFYAHINPGGISYTSQRKSVNDELIPKEDNVPHLRDLKLPEKYQGFVLQGELFHPRGFNVVSGILNSKAHRAVATQRDVGVVHYAPWKIFHGPNGEENLPYDKQYAILKEMSKDLPHFFEPPRTSDKPIKDFHEEIGRQRGEGIVLTDLETGEKYKMKHRFDYDLRIAGFTDGTGRLKDSGIGAIRLEDRNGKDVGHVGTGLTDEMRRDMYKHPNKYIGKLIKVDSKKSLIGKLREPTFLGFTTDKNDPDELT